MTATSAVPSVVASQLPPDDRSAQCERAACFMETHPGCTAAELKAGADLGCERKVVSEMRRTFGYSVKSTRNRVPCLNGTRSRRVTRYWLESRPVKRQTELFDEE